MMLAQTLAKVVQAIANDMLCLAQLVVDQNGLKDGALSTNIQAKVREEGNPVIEIVFDHYLQYLEAESPHCGKRIPIDELRDWALQNNLPIDNRTLYAIAQKIWEIGQTPQPILALLQKEIEHSFDNEWSDKILDAIVSEIEKSFKFSE